MLRVRDIVKFGRVNFKITEINCDRIDKEFTGTCHSTNLSNMMFTKQTKNKTGDVKPHVSDQKPKEDLAGTQNINRENLDRSDMGINNVTEVNLETIVNNGRASLNNLQNDNTVSQISLPHDTSQENLPNLPMLNRVPTTFT